MSEYIIKWSGIAADISDMLSSGMSPLKVVKEIRKARLHEPIVRCRDCKQYGYGKYATHCYRFVHKVEPNGFCAWGERKVDK